MSLNRVVLVGRLTRDPEMRYTPSGVAVASMGIAVNRFTKNEQGDYETDFFDVVAWRRTAEFAQNYLTKGRLVSVDGRLQNRSWVGQDGVKRTKTEIVADDIQGLDRKGDTQPGGGEPEAGARTSAPRAAAGAPAGGHAGAAPAEDDLEGPDPFADE
jgi:single-strand DNA-binding protein